MTQARKAFIFDLDGTLFDSAPQIISAANSTRTEFGFQVREKDFYDPVIGLPAINLFFDLNLSDTEVEIFISKFREYLSNSIITGNNLFPGAAEFLQKSHELDIFIGIATTKPSSLARLVIKNSNIHYLIDHVQGTDNFKAKPDPTVILLCLDKFKTSQAIMFGDRNEDMVAGKLAGIDSVGISQGVHSFQDLSENGADLVVDNFVTLMKKWDQVIDLLEKK